MSNSDFQKQRQRRRHKIQHLVQVLESLETRQLLSGCPNGPFNLTANAVGGSSVAITFTDNADNETGFVILRATSANGPYAQVGTAGPSAGTLQSVNFTDNGAPAGSTLYYQAYAVNGLTYQSSFAGPASATTSGTGTPTPTPTPAPTPTPVQNSGGPPNGPFALASGGATTTTATLTFIDNAANETGFVVEKATSVSGPFAAVATLPAAAGTHSTVTYVDSSNHAGGVYYYRVYAINGGYQSSTDGPLQISSAGVGTPTPTPNPTPTPTPTPTKESARNLLFFGNSFTYYNTVPSLVADIAAADGHPAPNVQMEAFPNWTLGQHLGLQNSNGAAIINTSLAPGGKWDDVVLQEQSTKPTSIGDIGGFRADAAALFAKVKAHSPGVHAVFEQTWARGSDNPLYPGSFSSPGAMQDQLLGSNSLAAGDLNAGNGAGTAEVAPVGEAWRALNWNRNLYDGPDEFHPSPKGSLIAALTLYTSIYHDGASDIPAARVTADLARLGLTAADWLAVTALTDGTNKAAVTTA